MRGSLVALMSIVRYWGMPPARPGHAPHMPRSTQGIMVGHAPGMGQMI